MDPMHDNDNASAGEHIVGAARIAALGSGVTGLLALVMVLGGETALGPGFVGTGWAVVAGWLGFASACLLVLGVTGLLAAAATTGSPAERRAAWTLQLAASVMAGAAATLPLVVVGIVDRAPELIESPPAMVPATFILSGVALGGAGIWLAVLLRRRSSLPSWCTTLLIAASVLAIVPLPSRQFLLGFAVAALLRAALTVVPGQQPADARAVERGRA